MPQAEQQVEHLGVVSAPPKREEDIRKIFDVEEEDERLPDEYDPVYEGQEDMGFIDDFSFPEVK